MKTQEPGSKSSGDASEISTRIGALSAWPPQALWVVSLTFLLAFGQFLPAAKFFASPANYLPLHTFSEFIAMAVSAMVFALAWNLRHQGQNSHRIILGAGVLAVALIDFAHTLSFAGMPDFLTPSSPEKAISFWLAGRYIAAAIFIAVAFLPVRRWTAAASRAAMGIALAIVTYVPELSLYLPNVVMK